MIVVLLQDSNRRNEQCMQSLVRSVSTELSSLRQYRVRDPQEAIALRSLFTFVFHGALRPQTPYGSLGTGIVYLTLHIMYITSTHDLVRLLLSTVPHPRIGGLCCRFFELEAVAPADWLPNSTPPAPIGGGKCPGS